MSLEVGKTVPDFSLIADNGKAYKLSNNIKKNVLLVFYIGDGNPVCVSQFADYNKNYKDFKSNNVEIIAISTGDPKTQAAFKKENNLPFVFVSDSEAKVSKDFDCYNWFGTKRAVFLIDSNLELKYKSVESVSIFKKTAEELLEIIKES